jgi:hypothetical protein
MRSWKLRTIAILSALNFTQCASEVESLSCDVASDVAREISYSRDVFPIVGKSCAIPTCHVAAFPKGDFTKYEDLKSKVENGMLTFKLGNGQMPPEFSKLPLPSPCEIKIITAWINQGAKNN